MGMILTCAREALAGAGAAFVICGQDLNVKAVSRGAERIFGKESGLLGSHLLDHVTSPVGDDQLVHHAGVAAQRDIHPVVMPLRLIGSAKTRMLGTLVARVASCGSPRAALVTVAPSAFGRR
jgi:hypothetical protein